mgnify:CR=1 FL=1
MYTEDRFKTEWQRLHHPSMDVSGDVSFYYGVYKKLNYIVSRSRKTVDNTFILNILMYIENTASISLDAFYERMYRSVDDVVGYWCRKYKISSEDSAIIYDLVSDAVADAPESSLKKWIKECVLSSDFQKLKDVALFLAKNDPTIRMLYPDLRYRKDAYLKIADGDKDKAQQMLWSDMAFNWCDREGLTLLSRLAERFDRMKDGKETADILKSITSMPLDKYLPLRKNGNLILTLIKNNTPLDVVFPYPVSENNPDYSLICQLVSYFGKIYVNGPIVFSDSESLNKLDCAALLQNVKNNEEESTKHEFFTTPFGNRYSRYQDLYENINNQDITTFKSDEPNILDFINWFSPETLQAK